MLLEELYYALEKGKVSSFSYDYFALQRVACFFGRTYECVKSFFFNLPPIKLLHPIYQIKPSILLFLEQNEKSQ